MPETPDAIIKIKSEMRLWPSFWRHPIRHVRLKRFWKRAIKQDEELRATPLGRQLCLLEDEAFLYGSGAKEDRS